MRASLQVPTGWLTAGLFLAYIEAVAQALAADRAVAIGATYSTRMNAHTAGMIL